MEIDQLKDELQYLNRQKNKTDNLFENTKNNFFGKDKEIQKLKQELADMAVKLSSKNELVDH